MSAPLSANVRQRLHPSRSDADYLVLSDLRLFINRFRSADRLSVLDYGSGESPYRSLFPNSDYRRADFEPRDTVDYTLSYDSTIPERNGSFDVVLSTQVAEHLPDPGNYFKEAHRMLKQGGRLIITTHGTWQDHGVPYDFQRWTAEGLKRDLESAAFSVDAVYKLTASTRCHLFLIIYWLSSFNFERQNLLTRVTGRLIRTVIRVFRPAVHWIVDNACITQRIVESTDLAAARLYIVVAAVATKRRR